MQIIEPESKYKTPLTLEEQLELLGELWSAQAEIKRLENGRDEFTKLIQDLMKEIEQKDKRWTNAHL